MTTFVAREIPCPCLPPLSHDIGPIVANSSLLVPETLITTPAPEYLRNLDTYVCQQKESRTIPSQSRQEKDIPVYMVAAVSPESATSIVHLTILPSFVSSK